MIREIKGMLRRKTRVSRCNQRKIRGRGSCCFLLWCVERSEWERERERERERNDREQIDRLGGMRTKWYIDATPKETWCNIHQLMKPLLLSLSLSLSNFLMWNLKSCEYGTWLVLDRPRCRNLWVDVGTSIPAT